MNHHLPPEASQDDKRAKVRGFAFVTYERCRHRRFQPVAVGEFARGEGLVIRSAKNRGNLECEACEPSTQSKCEISLSLSFERTSRLLRFTAYPFAAREHCVNFPRRWSLDAL